MPASAQLHDLAGATGVTRRRRLLTSKNAGQAPAAAELATVADKLERVVAEAEPQKAKALLRLVIEQLRVNRRGEILPNR